MVCFDEFVNLIWLVILEFLNSWSFALKWYTGTLYFSDDCWHKVGINDGFFEFLICFFLVLICSVLFNSGWAKEKCNCLSQFRFRWLRWVQVFKNGPSKICGRQPLKNLKVYGLLWRICEFNLACNIGILEFLKLCAEVVHWYTIFFRWLLTQSWY